VYAANAHIQSEVLAGGCGAVVLARWLPVNKRLGECFNFFGVEVEHLPQLHSGSSRSEAHGLVRIPPRLDGATEHHAQHAVTLDYLRRRRRPLSVCCQPTVATSLWEIVESFCASHRGMTCTRNVDR